MKNIIYNENLKENKKSKKTYLHNIIKVMCFLINLSCIINIIYNFFITQDLSTINIITPIAIISISTIICIYIYDLDNYTKENDDEYRKYLIDELNIYDYINKREQISENKDIIALMLKNNDETTDYFKISKRQAQSSFWFSIIACIIGIITICLSLYAIFEINDIQFAVISIVGGTVTELIAGTVLVIHNKSALQLNYYYDALHENEKFLSAINLADKLENSDKTKMYMEIIKAQIKSDERAKSEDERKEGKEEIQNKQKKKKKKYKK